TVGRGPTILPDYVTRRFNAFSAGLKNRGAEPSLIAALRINCGEKYMVDRTGGSNMCRPTPHIYKAAVVASLALLLVFSAANGQDPATVGQFSSVTNWPYVAAHAHVLPTGK